MLFSSTDSALWRAPLMLYVLLLHWLSLSKRKASSSLEFVGYEWTRSSKLFRWSITFQSDTWLIKVLPSQDFQLFIDAGLFEKAASRIYRSLSLKDCSFIKSIYSRNATAYLPYGSAPIEGKDAIFTYCDARVKSVESMLGLDVNVYGDINLTMVRSLLWFLFLSYSFSFSRLSICSSWCGLPRTFSWCKERTTSLDSISKDRSLFMTHVPCLTRSQIVEETKFAIVTTSNDEI